MLRRFQRILKNTRESNNRKARGKRFSLTDNMKKINIGRKCFFFQNVSSLNVAQSQNPEGSPFETY